MGSIPGSGRAPGGGKRQPAPVFLPEKCHGQRSPVGYSPTKKPGGLQSDKESDATEVI